MVQASVNQVFSYFCNIITVEVGKVEQTWNKNSSRVITYKKKILQCMPLFYRTNGRDIVLLERGMDLKNKGLLHCFTPKVIFEVHQFFHR